MSSYDNSNSGVLFKNDRKQTERHPDYTGSFVDANGVEHWLSCWIKTSQTGKKFMSLSVGAPKEQQQQQAAAPAPQQAVDQFDDDVPF